jgi:tetratricopeptide (TPR) repeat protein
MGTCLSTPSKYKDNTLAISNNFTVAAASNENEVSAIPTTGILLSHLLSLKNKWGNFNMREIKKRFILKVTSKNKCSYAASLQSNPAMRHMVNEVADVFISYAWTYSFKDLLAALSENPTDRYVWIDAFVLNQHMLSATATDVLREMFSKALQKIGNSEVVLIPYDDPIPAHRIWCVFEQYIIVTNNINWVPRMTPVDREEFKKKLSQGSLGVKFFFKIFSAIDVEKAEAEVENDRATILKLVREVGVSNVNKASLGSVKKWMLDVAIGLTREVGERSKESAYVFTSVSALHQALGQFEEALSWLDKSLTLLRINKNLYTINELNEQILNSLIAKAATLKGLKRYLEELSSLNEALLFAKHDYIKRNIILNQIDQAKTQMGNVVDSETVEFVGFGFGYDVPEESLSAHGMTKYRQGHLAEAVEFLLVALDNLTLKNGNVNPEVAAVQYNLSLVYRDQGRVTLAKESVEKALTCYKNLLGIDHPDTRDAQKLMNELNNL